MRAHACAHVVIESTIIRGSELVPFVFGFEMLVDAMLEVGWLQGLRWRELESPTWKVGGGGDGSQSVPVSTASPPQTVASTVPPHTRSGCMVSGGCFSGGRDPLQGDVLCLDGKRRQILERRKAGRALEKIKSVPTCLS